MQEARRIQLAWLPDRERSSDGLQIATVNHPASHISGDFYNFFDLPDGRTALVIGDVTGHGMSAAFLMATAQLLVRTTLPGYCDPAACLAEVNRQLCTQVFNGQFVTMVVAIIDRDNRRLEIASAGHPPPLINDGAGFRVLPMDTNFLLGVEPDAEFSSLHLRPGSAHQSGPLHRRRGRSRSRRPLPFRRITARAGHVRLRRVCPGPDPRRHARRHRIPRRPQPER